MMKKLKEGRLREKIGEADAKKLNSICSVIHQYFPAKIINEIKAEALNKAKEDYVSITSAERTEIAKNQWSNAENWTLLWCTCCIKTRKKTNKRFGVT